MGAYGAEVSTITRGSARIGAGEVRWYPRATYTSAIAQACSNTLVELRCPPRSLEVGCAGSAVGPQRTLRYDGDRRAECDRQRAHADLTIPRSGSSLRAQRAWPDRPRDTWAWVQTRWSPGCLRTAGRYGHQEGTVRSALSRAGVQAGRRLVGRLRQGLSMPAPHAGTHIMDVHYRCGKSWRGHRRRCGDAGARRARWGP